MAYNEPARVVGGQDDDEIVLSNYSEPVGADISGVELAIVSSSGEGKCLTINLSFDDVDKLIEALEQAKEGF